MGLWILTGATQKAVAAQWNRPTHHDLSVTLDPARHSAKIEDLVTLYPGDRKEPTVTFLLHVNYKTVETEIPHKGDWEVKFSPAGKGNTSLQKITVHKPKNQPWPDFLQIKFWYQGTYVDTLRESGEPIPGTSSKEKDHGIFLSGASYFYPTLEDPSGKQLMTFSLRLICLLNGK